MPESHGLVGGKRPLAAPGASPVSVVVVDDGTIDHERSALAPTFPLESATSFTDWLVAVADGDQPDGSTTAGMVTLETADGPRRYRRESHPAVGVDATRIEVFEDCTALVELDENLDLFERLAERTQDGLYAADADGHIAYCNPSFADLLGTDSESVSGTAVADYVTGPDRDRFGTALDALGEESEVIELTCERADGERVVLELHLSARADGEGHVGVARDVTARRESERRLEQYRTLVESAGDPMYVLDSDGTITLANEAMAALVDERPSSLVGKNARAVFDAAAIERGQQAIRDVLTSERTWESYELTVETPDGGTHWFEATVGVLQSDDGEFRGTVATLRDITDRERQQRDIDLLKRTLAHVARTNLESELADIEAAMRNLDAAGASVETGTIRSRTERLASLPSKVAAIERIVDTDPDPVDHTLRPLVVDSVDAVTDTKPAADVEIRVPEGVTVRAIPAFGLAVENLVENALRHAGDAPSVTIEAAQTANAVTLSVADDGPGIPSDELAVLKRGEETALEHGSGVGLWLVDWVVRASDGTLSYDHGDGATVTIRLDRPGERSTPTPAREEQTEERTETDPVTDAEGMTVLYVDVDREAITRVEEYVAAEDTDVSVLGATDGAVAADHLASEDVDCLVTERLPDEEWDTLLDAVDDSLPVALYTDADHSDLDEGTFTAIDTLVQKGLDQSRVALLFGKIRSLTGGNDTPEDGDDDGETASVGETTTLLVTDDGEYLLSETGPPPDAPLDAMRADAEGDGTAVRIVGDGRRVYRFQRRPLGDATVEHVRDLTGEVRRERRRRLLETLIGQAEDGISVVDAEGTVAYHNDAFSDILGYDDMVGDHASTFMAEGELERGQLAVQRLLASPSLESEVHDIDMVTADGETVTVADHFAVRYVDGEYGGLINVARDITERKRRERRLEQYRTLVESAADPMYVLDESGTVELANEAMVEFAGLARDDLLGTDVQTMSTPEKVAQGRAAIREILADEDREYATYETTFEVDGRRRHFEVTVGVIIEDDGFDGSVSTFREITDRKRRTEELTRLKQILDRVLRHNLRNDLMVVMGQVGVLADTAEGETARAAETVIERCRHLLRTADNARTVEKTLQTNPEAVTEDIHEVLREAVGRVPSGTPEGLRVRCRRELPAALRLLADGLSDSDHPVLPAVAVEGNTVRVRFDADGRDLTVPEALSAVDFAEDLPVALWLVDWVLDASGGTVDTAEESVEIRLQRASSV